MVAKIIVSEIKELHSLCAPKHGMRYRQPYLDMF